MILPYLKRNWLVSAVIIYEVLGVILHLITGVDITIPCLFTLVVGMHCPGCGLTHAFTSLIMLDFLHAWESNPLIFFVLPAGTFLIIRDFLKFKNTQLAYGNSTKF